MLQRQAHVFKFLFDFGDHFRRALQVAPAGQNLEPLEGGAWSVRLYHKPFIDWIWGGCLVMAVGGVLAISDRRYRLAWRRKEVEVPGGTQMARQTVS